MMMIGCFIATVRCSLLGGSVLGGRAVNWSVGIENVLFYVPTKTVVIISLNL